MRFGEREHANPGRVRDELCALLSTQRARDTLRLTGERAWALAELKRHFGGATQRTQDLVRRMQRVGLIDGSDDAGYRLTAVEALELIRLVNSGPSGEGLWTLLARSTDRTILAALIAGPCTRDELRRICPAPRLTEALGRLRPSPLVVCLDDERRLYGLTEHRSYCAKVLQRIELLAYGLSVAPAEHARANARAIAYEPASLLVTYETGPVAPRLPPPRTTSALHGREHAQAEMYVRRSGFSDMTLDVGSLGVVPPRRLSRPTGEFVGVLPLGDLYPLIDVFFVRLLRGLRSLPHDARQARNTFYERSWPKPHAFRPTDSQLRGRSRKRRLARPEPWTRRDIEAFAFPTLVWESRATDTKLAVPDMMAAAYSTEANTIVVNMEWDGLYRAQTEWIQPHVPAALHNGIMNFVAGRHALRLVERILLHENDAAERPDGEHAPVPAEALTFAAHWNETELADARRVIHQHLAAHRRLRAPRSRTTT